MVVPVLLWLALAGVDAAFPEFPSGQTSTLDGNVIIPVQSGPPPTNGQSFYMKVFRLTSLMSVSDFRAKYIHQSTNNDLYEKYFFDQTTPGDRQSFQNPPKLCRSIWDPLTVLYQGVTYTITEDPDDNTQLQSTADHLPFPINWVRTCTDPSQCIGCNFDSSSSYIGYLVTNDEKPTHTVFAYGICLGWIQVDCTALTTCNNGQYATNYLIHDPVTSCILNSVNCLSCLPGTWNTCRTPTKNCFW